MPYIDRAEDAQKRLSKAIESLERIYPFVFSAEGLEHFSTALDSLRASLEDVRR